MKEVEFKRPMLEDQELLETYFKKFPSRSCERTFVNVFLWARAYGVEYAMIENTIVFRSQSEVGCSFSYPVGEPKDVQRTIESLQEHCESKGGAFRMYNVTEENFRQLESWYPD
ncbi:MAG: phosphatidylglycerol lysyltransferase domain-containing protein, partial [Lachnospiraceae bacterium]